MRYSACLLHFVCYILGTKKKKTIWLPAIKDKKPGTVIWKNKVSVCFLELEKKCFDIKKVCKHTLIRNGVLDGPLSEAKLMWELDPVSA